MTKQDALKQGFELMTLLNHLMEEHDITTYDIAEYAFNIELLNKVKEQA
jgi:hypothetical protein